MAEAAKESAKGGGGRKRLLLGLALAATLGGAGFYAAYSGAIPSPLGGGEAAAKPAGLPPGPPPPAYLALDPILVTIGSGAAERHLQFAAQLEIEETAREAATTLAPRALDVLNTYLRAVAPSDVEDPAAMLRMRAQMLRRIKVVMGESVVRDLLVSEFILR